MACGRGRIEGVMRIGFVMACSARSRLCCGGMLLNTIILRDADLRAVRATYHFAAYASPMTPVGGTGDICHMTRVGEFLTLGRLLVRLGTLKTPVIFLTYFDHQPRDCDASPPDGLRVET